ncbi:MAG: hypothetical protein WAL63_11465 [Solirubrobacteraceae bacterium]
MDRTLATRVMLLAMVHGIFQRARKVWGLKVNPVDDVEKPPLRGGGGIEVFLTRGGLGTRPLGSHRARRGDLLHGGIYRPAPRRAACAPLARRRFSYLGSPRPR